MAQPAVRLLLVGADEDDYRLIVAQPWGGAGASPPHLEWVATYEDGLTALARAAHDDAPPGDRPGPPGAPALLRGAATDALARAAEGLAAAQAIAHLGSWETDCATGASSWSTRPIAYSGMRRAPSRRGSGGP